MREVPRGGKRGVALRPCRMLDSQTVNDGGSVTVRLVE
jgi:hypothetical protein